MGGKLLRGAGQAPIDGGVTVGAGPVSGPITGGLNDVPLHVCGVELQPRASKSPDGRNTRFLPAPGSLAAIKQLNMSSAFSYPLLFKREPALILLSFTVKVKKRKN